MTVFLLGLPWCRYTPFFEIHKKGGMRGEEVTARLCCAKSRASLRSCNPNQAGLRLAAFLDFQARCGRCDSGRPRPLAGTYADRRLARPHGFVYRRVLPM